MRRQLFHVEYPQAVGLQDSHSGEHREIRKVLVVNRVELVAFDQPQQMGKLQRQDSFGLQ